MKAEADNRLRAATEIHLFWVIVVAFVLKVDLADERIGLRAYDLALVITGIICVPVAAVGAVANKMYRASNRVWLRQRRPLSTLSTTTANNERHHRKTSTEDNKDQQQRTTTTKDNTYTQRPNVQQTQTTTPTTE